MVLDPFSSLSLAGNILQFIDFGFKLVSEAKEIHTSTNGTSSQHDSWDEYSQQLIHITSSLEDASSTGANVYQSDLMDLCGNCADLAKIIQEHLRALKQIGPRTLWKSFVQAMKQTGRETLLNLLCDRLRKLQSLLSLRLVALMFARQSSVVTELKNIFDENRRLEMDRYHDLDQSRKDIIESLKIFEEKTELQKSTIENHLSRIQRLKPVNDSDIADFSKKLNSLSERLSRLAQEGTTVVSEQRFLKTLWFTGMRDREENVRNADKSTLHWIFDGTPPKTFKGKHPKLAQWLEKESEIYWVQGKPGSGKSTLMKYLCGHPKTQEILERWASPKRLVTASYFFWYSGGNIQRSLKGLLQSLLYEVLRKAPELISQVCPDFDGARYQNDYEPWTFSEVKDAFSNLRGQHEISVRFCFFIDGLDEYDIESAQGTHGDLVHCLQDLSQSPDIKLCLASRPWNVFMDAFGKSASGTEAEWMLKLEDLNRGDIDAFVRTSFENNNRFVQVRGKDSRYDELITEIVDKSQGVFLWVFLVIRSLEVGLIEGDRIVDLQNRLRLIPPSLKDFFGQILGSVNEVYQSQTAELFTIMLETPLPLSLMTLSIMYEEDQDYCFQKLGSLSKVEHRERENTTRKRINARCKGLVEVTILQKSGRFAANKIDFIHRTVRDFLQNKEMEDLFKRVDRNFNPHLALAKAFLAQIKLLPVHDRLDEAIEFLKMLAYSARQMEDKTDPSRILDEAKNALECEEEEFIGFLAQRGIARYVVLRISNRPRLTKNLTGRPLLDYALDPEADGYTKPTIRAAIVEAALRHGADPNTKYAPKMSKYGDTVWTRFIKRAYRPNGERTALRVSDDDLFAATKLLLAHGAEAKQTVYYDGFSVHGEVEEPRRLEWGDQRMWVAMHNDKRSAADRIAAIDAIKRYQGEFSDKQRAEMARWGRNGFRVRVHLWLSSMRSKMLN